MHLMPSIRHALIPTRWLALPIALGVALAACSSTSPAPDAAASAVPTGATETVPTPSPDAKGAALGPSGAPPARQSSTPAPVAAARDIPAIKTDVTVIAQEHFVHSGFRTQVDHSIEIVALPPMDTGGGLIVNLENLSTPTGSISTRATINFARQFDNYIEIPTSAGTLVLHLHRDGTLRSTPDDGPFT